ncbi:TPA: helix-turn-helix transcriptional regulator [Clostridium perfringens]|uniref:helix-turn-helix domain-containing protein n=1 Tax=Clostridium perfringens TaxID=1502 RepID=UPI001A1D1052|nr:helix-turn-helix transcriptional regulator [Clostridium perfringens]MDK0658205.1 helix-turn-helix transcriptional regulator [Clostridium perfringens]MDK0943473.1 helix-turn-helix transcriptional regulator [Clostridium perfringens]MDK0960993.1 helix-turn-helix transcriptional regulator [Clostridium perfringens]MDK0963969.1 helix-turn-helix transcriptional regulator [Clostridium perfringens]MDK0969783.1 helix-turn-helix transcriptional regulator [Clostridium perfringens]
MKLDDERYISKVNELRMLRKKLRLTLKEVGERLNISGSALSQFEGFRATLSNENIKKYERLLKRVQIYKE